MASKNLQPASQVYLPPIIGQSKATAHRSEATSVLVVRSLLVALSAAVLVGLLVAILWAGSEEPVAQNGDDLRNKTASPTETLILILVSTLLPIALGVAAGVKLPREVTLMVGAPLALALVVLLVLAVSELGDSMRFDRDAHRDESSLYLVYSMAATCGLISSVLGLLFAMGLATMRRD